MRRKEIDSDRVLQYIDHFLQDPKSANDWDEFLCVPIKDSHLEAIRQRVTVLPSVFPVKKGEGFCGPQGIEELRQIATDLRASTWETRGETRDSTLKH